MNEVRAWRRNFDRTSVTRWVSKGYLVRLRQGWYAFGELLKEAEFSRYIAYKMCQPSYISLHCALSFYGIIPEAVTQVTSVTTKRTTSYSNAFGDYTYQSVKPELFYGYRQYGLQRGGSYLLAEPEKAIVDLLYLYPQYESEEDMRELRFDEWWMSEELDKERLRRYVEQSGVKSLEKRVEVLLKSYGIK